MRKTPVANASVTPNAPVALTQATPQQGKPRQFVPSTASPSVAGTTAGTRAPDPPLWLTRWHDAAEAVQASVATLAIIVGAIWTYWLFVRRRAQFPRANIQHDVTHWDCGEHALIHLVARVTNVGDGIMVLSSILGRVQRLLRFPTMVDADMQAGRDPVAPGETEIAWPLVCERQCKFEICHEVEPGETHEIHLDFFAPKHLEVVEVYSYIRNAAKPGDIGWNTTSIYRMADAQARCHLQTRTAEEQMTKTPGHGSGTGD